MADIAGLLGKRKRGWRAEVAPSSFGGGGVKKRYFEHLFRGRTAH
jgi:hypothetical protein